MLDALIFAIDGGGTTSRGAVFSPDGESYCKAFSGPCNPTSDLDGSVASVNTILQDLSASLPAELKNVEIRRLGLAAAGLVQSERRRAFLEQVSFQGETIAMTDGYAALIGAGAGKPCGLIVAGTGTAAHQLLADATSRQIGGWGWIGGDQGSGAWIGREALQAALLARDNMIVSSLLTEHVNTVIGADSSKALDWLAEAQAAELGSLAPYVFEAAEGGQNDAPDPLASGILDQAANHIAALGTALDLSGGDPLYVVGSIGERLRPRLKTILDRELGSAVSEPKADALFGAYLVASGEAPPETTHA